MEKLNVVNVLCVIWLIALTIFGILYVSYDRKMQEIDLRMDDIRVEIHDKFLSAIRTNERNIDRVIEAHNQLVQEVYDES